MEKSGKSVGAVRGFKKSTAIILGVDFCINTKRNIRGDLFIYLFIFGVKFHWILFLGGGVGDWWR